MVFLFSGRRQYGIHWTLLRMQWTVFARKMDGKIDGRVHLSFNRLLLFLYYYYYCFDIDVHCGYLLLLLLLFMPGWVESIDLVNSDGCLRTHFTIEFSVREIVRVRLSVLFCSVLFVFIWSVLICTANASEANGRRDMGGIRACVGAGQNTATARIQLNPTFPITMAKWLIGRYTVHRRAQAVLSFSLFFLRWLVSGFIETHSNCDPIVANVFRRNSSHLRRRIESAKQFFFFFWISCRRCISLVKCTLNSLFFSFSLLPWHFYTNFTQNVLWNEMCKCVAVDAQKEEEEGNQKTEYPKSKCCISHNPRRPETRIFSRPIAFSAPYTRNAHFPPQQIQFSIEIFDFTENSARFTIHEPTTTLLARCHVWTKTSLTFSPTKWSSYERLWPKTRS